MFRMKSLGLIFLGLLVFFSVTTGTARSVEKVIFSDDFDSYNIKTWGPQPVTGITIQDGILTAKPQTSQIWLASLKKFKNVTFETRVKFNKLSIDSTIFYYLGFCSVTPLFYQSVWVNIQDGAFFASARKEGKGGVREVVAYVKENKWYTIKIVWSESLIEFYLDGEKVYKTEDKEVIPEASMPIFLDANTLGTVPADLDIDWVTIKGEPKE